MNRIFPSLVAVLVWVHVGIGLSWANEVVVLEQPELAGISGLRQLWNKPVVLSAEGAQKQVDRGQFGQAVSAVWTSDEPGAIAFDAVHRSVLVRFPHAADAIAEQLQKGMVIAQVHLVLPFRSTELWPEGMLDPAGMSFLGDQWTRRPPRWHAVAYALRRPWVADAQLGPTFNAAVHGRVYWSRFAAQSEKEDRYPTQLGPAEVSQTQPEGRLDVTALLMDSAYGSTLAQRLRQFADCGLLIRKWEVYDASYWPGGYEWATATGARGILINTPKLEITFTKPEQAPTKLDALPLAVDARTMPASGQPTAVLPDEAQLKTLAERFSFRQPEWMPDWQWKHVKELHQRSGAWVFPSTMQAYEKWIDDQLGFAPRRWAGFDATDRAQMYFKYLDAIPEPVREHWKLYWWSWLMPDRDISQLVQGYIGGKEAAEYYERTRDWRGNFSVYRTYCHAMGTMNFNHWAVAGTLMGGAILNSDRLLADGRHGLEHWPLRTWCWFDGSTQESIDHYYFAHSLTAQKVFADFGPDIQDRLMGQSILAKSIEELTSAFHPGLRRFVSSSGRTGIAYMLGIQDGLHHILHTLSKHGVYTDSNTEKLTVPNFENMPTLGHDFKSGLAAQQTLNGPWAPSWMHLLVDDKPLPFESTVTFKQWGSYAQTPLWRRSYQGQHYGLASVDVSVGNETIPVMALWRRSSNLTQSMTDLGALLIRPGLNRTELLDSIWHDSKQRNPNGAVGTQGSHLVTLQHRNKAVVLTSPYDQFKYEGGRPIPVEVTSVQTTVGLFHFLENTPWNIYVDEQPVTSLPLTVRYGQRITLHDGVTFIALIPITPANFPRTQDVVISDTGQMTEMQGGGKAREALRIDAYLIKQDTPLTSEQIAQLDTAYAGYIVEIADSTEFKDFTAFQQHIKTSSLELNWQADARQLSLSYRSGSDHLELGYLPAFTGGWNRALPTDQVFPYRRVNGAWPFLAPGVERDTTVSQITTTGRVEKHGALLQTEAGKTAYLFALPEHGIFSAWNPLPDPTDFLLTLPNQMTIQADGKLGITNLLLNTQTQQLDITTAPGHAKTLIIRNAKAALKVQVNGQPVTPTRDGETWRVPLP